MSTENHICVNSRIKTSEGEYVCRQCGALLQQDPFDTSDNDQARMAGATDHYCGNGLLGSVTEQNSYVSRTNPGVAFTLSGTRGRDFQGKKIVKQIQGDGYRAGCIVDKGCVMKVDSLTGETELKFSLVDSPYFPYLKQKANIALSRNDLSNVDRSIIEIYLKQVCQTLALGPMADFCWQAAALNSGLLKPNEAQEIEARFYETIEILRPMLLSHCDRKLAARLKEEDNTPQTEVQPIKAS